MGLLVGVDQDAVAAHALQVFAMLGDAAVDDLVVGVGRVEEADALFVHSLDGSVNVVGVQRDVLDALATVFLEVLVDLALGVPRLVDRDADLAGGRGHGPRLSPVCWPLMSK